jgi:hypothetical protein
MDAAYSKSLLLGDGRLMGWTCSRRPVAHCLHGLWLLLATAFCGCSRRVPDRPPLLLIEFRRPGMQGYGQAVEGMLERHLVADRIERVE